MVHSHGVSDAGRVRQTNEDCFFADDELALFVVADGMGGHAAGEVASRMAVESVTNFIRRSQDSEDLSWPCGIDPALSFTGNRVRTAVYLANRRVFRLAEEHDDYNGMGTTLVCALVDEGRVAIGHVGDSRLYIFSNGVLQQQTRDDTWAVTVLEGSGVANPDAVARHPMRNVLTNVLGAREQAEIHVSERDLAGGEVLLLCTDGVHGVLDSESLTGLVSAGGDVTAIAASVVAAALERGSRDNVTALVVEYRGGKP